MSEALQPELAGRSPRSPLTALTTRDDGTELNPASDEDWVGWISASRTRNFLKGDPLLDWLNRYGESHGFQPDDEAAGFDPRTDFLTFIFEQGRRFEEGVLRLIGERFAVTRIASDPEHARSFEHAVATLDAMVAGAPVIAQAVLRNPENRTYGIADLLVRSDILNALVPGTLDEDAASVGAPGLAAGALGLGVGAPGLRAAAAANAPGLGTSPWHYRVIDIKFSTLDLDVDRAAKASGALAYMAQVWVYNEALGRLQGYRPPASYLLGRAWKSGRARGTSCFERLARVDHDGIGDQRTNKSLAEMTEEAIDWLRRLRVEGDAWQVLPEPSVPELYPNARSGSGAPWVGANRSIATELGELTRLPGMTPDRRKAAHARGIRRWDEPCVSAATLQVPDKFAAQCDGVLAVNRGDGPGGPVVLPERISGLPIEWREPAALEFYVDFEAVSTLGDDFSRLPEIGGQSLIFQIGCGWWEAGEWRFAQWTVGRLTEAEEAIAIGAWIAHMDTLRAERGLTWQDVRLVHWWKAETASLDTAYNSARTRHGQPDWPILPWSDFLTQVVRAAPVTVRGAFGFGLKAIAKAMHEHGLIETVWAEGPTDGMGALVGAFWCDAEAARTGVPMPEIPLMIEIGQYNEVDCRSMAEIVAWLRGNR